MIGLKYLFKEFKDYKDCALRVKIEFVLDELKYAWQRAYRGYDSPMLWNIDGGFIELYLKILKDHRENLNSHPNYMTSEEWEEVLDEMIECLSNMNLDYWQNLYNIAQYEEGIKYKDRFFELFGKYFYDLWD